MKIKNQLTVNSQNRRVDENGYLFVENCPLLRTGVMEYLGSELCADEIDGVKIDKDKTYKLNISSEELKKSLHMFDLNPIVNEHTFLGLDEVNAKGKQEGSVGQDLRIEKMMDSDGVEREFIIGTVNFTNLETVDIIMKGEKEELSTAYVNDLVKSENPNYDFEVIDIKGNHVALVTKGRAGSKVRVINSDFINKNSNSTMKKNKYTVNGEEITSADLLKVLKEEAEYHKDKPVDDKTEGKEKEVNKSKNEDDEKEKSENEDEMPKDEKPMEKSENEDDNECENEDEEEKKENKKKSSNSVSMSLMNSAIAKVKEEMKAEFANRMKAYNSVKGKVGEFDHSDMDEKGIFAYALQNEGIDLDGTESLESLRMSFKVLNEKTRISNSFSEAPKGLDLSHIN